MIRWGCDPTLIPLRLYNFIAKEATKNLMKFLSTLHPPQDLCVTYFDEAPELGRLLWILLRLLAKQEPSTKAWYVFIGTKLSLSYYNPHPPRANRQFIRFARTRVTYGRVSTFACATGRRIGSTANLRCSWF